MLSSHERQTRDIQNQISIGCDILTYVVQSVKLLTDMKNFLTLLSICLNKIDKVFEQQYTIVQF